MHPRTHELFAYLDAQRTTLREAFESVPPELRETKPSPGCWSAADIIEHLAIVEERIAGRLSNAIADGRKSGLDAETSDAPVLPTFDTKRITDRTTRVTAPEPIRPTGIKADAAWQALDRASAAVRDALRFGDGLALGTLSLPHPLLGPLSLYHWFAFIGAHEARHAAQIRDIVSNATTSTSGA